MSSTLLLSTLTVIHTDEFYENKEVFTKSYAKLMTVLIFQHLQISNLSHC